MILPKKRLQVFVSSTYTDLKEERQAAVEAILTAGHIPAGMELFAAGDQSQMDVIRRWIDESDVYMLLLGGRYGSVEQTSGKSYTQLEYEYALDRGMPVFSVVVTEGHQEERIKRHGSAVLESDNPQKLRDFRALVTAKMVRFWADPRDIKLAVLETLADFARRESLRGWVPGDQAVNAGAVVEQIAQLTRENTELRRQLEHRTDPLEYRTYSGLTFEQVCKLLDQLPPPDLHTTGLEYGSLLDSVSELQTEIATMTVDEQPGESRRPQQTAAYLVLQALMPLGLSRSHLDYDTRTPLYELSNEGREFVVRLMAEGVPRNIAPGS